MSSVLKSCRRRATLCFLRSFLRDPMLIGAVVPSSRRLARAMVREIRLEEAQRVVELGPGTGAFTREIVGRTREDAVIMAIEADRSLCAFMKHRFPNINLVHGSAAELEAKLEQHGIDAADCVVSGLPWVAFESALQRAIIDAVVASLRPGGTFTTFAYCHTAWMPSALRLRFLLEDRFRKVRRSRIVWRNLPPAFVYMCEK